MHSDVFYQFINLDRSTERRAHMEQQLQSLGVRFARFAGIDGATVQPSLDVIDAEHYARCHGRDVRPGEVGCYLSHIECLRNFLQSDATYSVILEDDAILSPETPDIIAALTSPDMRDTWDFVRLQSRRRAKTARFRKINATHFLGITMTRSTGATAYLVNRRAAERMVERLLPIEVPWDHAFDRPLYLGVKYRAVFPYPVTYFIDGSVQSTIEISGPKKRRGLAKLPALWWRTRSETGRVVWALATWIKEKWRALFSPKA